MQDSQNLAQGNEIRNDGFQHREAFCVMEYWCKTCVKSEMIWNSRDGVTPFVIHCSTCGKEMRHINWHGDKREINHIPKKGERIFIDMPKEVHRIYMNKRVEDVYAMPSAPKPPDMTKEEVVEKLHQSWDQEKHEPFLITWE